MTARPTCRRHGDTMRVVEEGVLNGATVRYWACEGVPGQRNDACPVHGSSEAARTRRDDHRRALLASRWEPALACHCRPAESCPREQRTEEHGHEEPDLFGGDAA